jgi:hypothetical protein
MGPLMFAGVLVFTSCGGGDSPTPSEALCAEVRDRQGVLLDEIRERNVASAAAEAAQRAAELRGNFNVGSGDHQRALRAEFEKREELAVLAQQNPSCFSGFRPSSD